MADEPKATPQPANEPQPQLPKGGIAKIMPVLVPTLTLLVCAAAGFAVSRMFGAGVVAQTASAQQASSAQTSSEPEPTTESDKTETWYYDLDAVIANLNEPGVTRYVRVALTIEVGNGLAEEAGKVFFDRKKPLMKHWLTLYLSNQTVDGIRGERNLRLVQSQIAEALNQGLFPNTKPKIVRVLFKELSIQ
jgi:flagellar FliL protein